MPCYYDSPSEDNQIEIEKRSKERMYFEVLTLLTEEQVEEYEKNDLRQFPKDFNEGLCKICKILTKKQMESVSAYYWNIKWDHKTLYDWHLKHCEDDEKFNKETINE